MACRQCKGKARKSSLASPSDRVGARLEWKEHWKEELRSQAGVPLALCAEHVR
jgi:hypothetical protein